MPNSPLFYQAGNSQMVPFIMHDTSSMRVETIRAVSQKSLGSVMVVQPTQAFWVSEWSIMDPEPIQHCQKAPHSLALTLPPSAIKLLLSGLNSQAEGRAEDTRDHLKQKQSQLFCGLPCLHSESLVATFMGSQRFQEDNEMCVDSAQDFLVEAQEEEKVETVSLERQRGACVAHLTRTPLSSKRNFHLGIKDQDKQLGTPMKSRESKDQIIDILESISTQGSPGSPTSPGQTLLEEFSIPTGIPHAPEPELGHLTEQQSTEPNAVRQSQKCVSATAVLRDPSHCVPSVTQPSGDMTNAQVLCVQAEARENSPTLGEPSYPESQDSDKSKHSAQVLMLAEKKELPGTPKPARNHGKGDAEIGFSSSRQDRQPAEDQRPGEAEPRRESIDLTVSCQLSLQLPELPPRIPEEEEIKQNYVQDSQTKLNLTTESARITGTAQPTVCQASQDLSLLTIPVQGKPLQHQTPNDQILQGQVTTAHVHKSPSLLDSGFRNKFKHFQQYINPTTKGRVGHESVIFPAQKMNKTREQSAKRSLALNKGLVEKAKAGKTEGDPKAQPSPIEKQMGLAFLSGPKAADNRLRLRAHQLCSALILGQPRHCPRHCPRRPCAAQPGNPL
ncbi:PREDICTED: protein FAM205A-like [Elephantulus edwardii]|uniref:protein FAM205A-like n=1 Tax=Elephantulus edwardii TaxID=28737 RepID=UPI0003F0D465|nr:PREDICTED: protein FAM205A-like [Elephantulus edwardii]